MLFFGDFVFIFCSIFFMKNYRVDGISCRVFFIFVGGVGCGGCGGIGGCIGAILSLGSMLCSIVTYFCFRVQGG